MQADAVQWEGLLDDAKRLKSRPFLGMFGTETTITIGPSSTLPFDFMDSGWLCPDSALYNTPTASCHVTNEQLITSLKHKYRLQHPLSVASAGMWRKKGRAGRMCSEESVILLFLISALTSLFPAIWRGCRGPATVAEAHQQAQSAARFERRILEGNGLFAANACQCCILALWCWPAARSADVGCPASRQGNIYTHLASKTCP